jgi:hypothetical protein
MRDIKLDRGLTAQLSKLDAPFKQYLFKAKTLAELYALANNTTTPHQQNGFLEAFFAWHRKKVNDAALSAKNGRACIVGPGNCNDFTLESLAGHFGEVVLADADAEAPELARQRIPAALRGKVKISVCDASLFVGSLVSRAEKAIASASAAESAAVQARSIICSRPQTSDFIQMPFESGSFDFVLSDDVIPNILPLPVAWLDRLLKEKFGDWCSISSGGQIPPIAIAAATAHLLEAHRLLASNGILAVSACTACVTMAIVRGNPPEMRAVYSYERDGGTVLVSVPRLGFADGRHVGLDRVLAPLVSQNGFFSLVSSETYQLPFSEAQAGEVPGIGKTETFIAALNEFVSLKRRDLPVMQN